MQGGARGVSGRVASPRPIRHVLRSNDSGDLVLSATDLTNFLACPRLTQEQLRAALGLRGKLPKDDSPHSNLVKEHGDRHEADELLWLSAQAGGHETIELTGYTRAQLEVAAYRTAELM